MPVTSEKRRILIVDDDPSVTTSLAMLLRREGFHVETAETAQQALQQLQTPIDLVVQDMNFTQQTSGHEGLELLEKIKRLKPDRPVILLTAWGSIELAVAGIKAGAADFITKPWDNRQFLSIVRTALSLRDSAPAIDISREELDERYDFSAIIGHDPALLQILETIGRVAQTDASVLILGESGTGKEVIAQAIHDNSHRCSRPFIKVNLGGLSTTLFESEMFGHVRGAFTDAKSDRKGRFQLAHTGSIFLDEIGDLDLASQVKLLRVLSDRSFEPLGSSHTLKVDARIVSATNRDLFGMVAEGLFREDLLYRLNLITLTIPPLRERSGDLPALAQHFLTQATHAHNLESSRLSQDGRRWLAEQDWPGNIRELKQTMERAVLMTGKPVITASDLDRLDQTTGQPANRAIPKVGQMTLDQIEYAMIAQSLSHFSGNVSQAAKSLGLSRAALYRRIEKHGIQF